MTENNSYSILIARTLICTVRDTRHFYTMRHANTSHDVTSRRTARVVDYQHDVDAIDLHELHQEDAISDRVQSHHLHVLRRQLAVLRLRNFHQRLEDAVVQIGKKSE